MRYIYCILMTCLTSCVCGQNKTPDNFKADLTKALHQNFSEAELNKLFRTYPDLLTPHSDVTRLSQNLQGYNTMLFPLYDLKKSTLYINNITKLLTSPNKNHRILAYLIITASGDKSKENILLDKIKTEKNKGNLIWAGMALLYLHCDHTTALFDFLVKNEDLGDAHMLPMYIQLNKDSLQRTAYERINSENITAKIIAAQILSVTGLNEKTEKVLKQAVTNWNMNIKGYAIYSIKELEMGDLLDTFKPFLDSPKIRSIALQALANSPTKADQDHLIMLVNKEDTVDRDLLDCFYRSKNINNVKYWLSMITSKKTPANYVFFVFNQPIIQSDQILPDLQTALQNITNTEILGELVRALRGRTDDRSIDIMIQLLQHKNPTVRYWTANTLQENLSPRITTPEIKQLIAQGLKDGN